MTLRQFLTAFTPLVAWLTGPCTPSATGQEPNPVAVIRDALGTIERDYAEHAAALAAARVREAALTARVASLEAELAGHRTPPWPVRICVNADYRVMRAPALYGPDTWIAPRVWYGRGGDRAAAERYHAQAVTMLRSRGAVLGAELSATTVAAAADFDSFPSELIDRGRFNPPPAMLMQWPGDPSRAILDLAHTPTREQQAAFLIEAVTSQGGRYAFLDNGPELTTYLARGQIDAAIAFVADVNRRAAVRGIRLIWNFSLVPGSFGMAGYLPLDVWRRLLVAMEGQAIMFEQPWPAAVKGRADLTAKAVDQYRMIGDAGVAVVLIETVESPRELWEWCKTWRRAVDRVYLATMFDAPLPTWLAP